MRRRPLTVLVVDDSAVMRQVTAAVLSRDPDLTVVAAADPIIAREKMSRRRPDVILLDLEMPRLDGLTFLRQLMRTDPIPVVVCSGASDALRALDEGAVDVVAKPRAGVREFLEESAVMLIEALRGAAESRLRVRPVPPPVPDRRASPARAQAAPGPATSLSARVVALGASTGGTEALQTILAALPVSAPALVIAQHMPAGFTAAFARRLDQLCAIEVKEAEQGDELRTGRALIAPGNRHLLVHRAGKGFQVEIADGPLVSRHRPSVDVLFRSAAAAAGASALGVLLTGMGRDGAEGLLAMRLAGAVTLAQDEASCVVFGMPRAAIELGAAQEVAPLEQMAERILTQCGSG